MKLASLIATSLLAASGLALADNSADNYDPALSTPQTSEHQDYQPVALSDQRAPLSRAEVVADLNLWREAGLSPAFGEGEQAHARAREEARMQYYLNLRNSPAFELEVRRVEQEQALTEAPAAEDEMIDD